jgi:hypothetical protein
METCLERSSVDSLPASLAKTLTMVKIKAKKRNAAFMGALRYDLWERLDVFTDKYVSISR